MPRRVPDLSRSRALVGYEPTRRARRDPRRDVIDASEATRVAASDLRASRHAIGAPRAIRCGATRSRSGACCSPPDATDAPLPRDRPDREHQHLQRQVRVLPARRDAPPAGHHGHGAVHEDRRTSASTLGIDARPDAQLRRAASSIGSSSRRCATPSSRGIPQVGMISNGSLITEAAARGMIDAGLDAINISVDASGKEVFETTRVGPELRQGDRQHRARSLRAARGSRAAAAEADPVVRPAEQLRRRAGLHRALAHERRQDPHHRPAQLGRHAQSRSRTSTSPATGRG